MLAAVLAAVPRSRTSAPLAARGSAGAAAGGGACGAAGPAGAVGARQKHESIEKQYGRNALIAAAYP